jgi:hypothetical protein
MTITRYSTNQTCVLCGRLSPGSVCPKCNSTLAIPTDIVNTLGQGAELLRTTS